MVFRYIHPREEASEVVNDGFVKLFTNIHTFEVETGTDNEKRFMGWLKKIMINSAIDRLWRNKANVNAESFTESDWNVPGDLPYASDILFYNDLIKIIKELPPMYRMVFNLTVIDSYTHAGVADMLGIPAVTSRFHLLRARGLLQEHITKMEDDKRCRT